MVTIITENTECWSVPIISNQSIIMQALGLGNKLVYEIKQKSARGFVVELHLETQIQIVYNARGQK